MNMEETVFAFPYVLLCPFPHIIPFFFFFNMWNVVLAFAKTNCVLIQSLILDINLRGPLPLVVVFWSHQLCKGTNYEENC
jgi:hypothetical protein